MTNIEIQARKLVEDLLNNYLPSEQLTIAVKGEFRGLYYPSGGRGLTVELEAIIEFLLKKSVLVLHEKLPSSNDYPVKPTRFVIAYNQQQAEEFLDTISIGDFSLRINTGEAKYKENKTKFKPSSKPFNLYKLFLENPRKRFEYSELCEVVGLGNNCGPKEIQELVNKQIKARLGIPMEHFQAEYGYTFFPNVS